MTLFATYTCAFLDKKTDVKVFICFTKIILLSFVKESASICEKTEHLFLDRACTRAQDFSLTRWSRSCGNESDYNDSSLFVNNLANLDRDVICAEWFSGYRGILTKNSVCGK